MRINALDTPYWEEDLAGVMGSRPDGVLLPKARSGGDVHTLSIALNHAEERAGARKGATRIIALTTEVPISLLQMHTYVGASSRLEGLSWGAEDLSGVIGAHANREADGRWTSPYQLARNLCLFTAAAADAQPIDTVFVNFRDAAGPARRGDARPRATASPARWPSTPTRWPSSTRCSRRRPEEIAVSEEIVKAFADNPEAGVLGIRGPDGRSPPPRPRRAHPRPRQGSAAGVNVGGGD